jgi:hypothetical protein
LVVTGDFGRWDTIVGNYWNYWELLELLELLGIIGIIGNYWNYWELFELLESLGIIGNYWAGRDAHPTRQERTKLQGAVN